MKNLTRAEAAERSATIAVTSYDVTLDLTGDDGFDSTCVARFTATRPGARTFVELDGEAFEVELNGRRIDPAEGTGNRIPLDDLAAVNVLRVVARCSYTNTGEGLHRFVDPADGETYLWAQSFLDDAQRMFACFDQPDLKATFDLTVRARPGWTVIGNERGTAHDDGTWTFASTERMSTYLFTVAAGPWAGATDHHDGIDLGVWCRQSLAPHLEADEVFAITKASFDLQHATFGRRYPFGTTYDQVFAPEFNEGAMENPGAVVVAEDFLFRSRVTMGERRTRAMVLAHEMSHMWFGNLVTMRWWDDLWLNESFAELLGHHTVDRAGLYDGVWADFVTARKAWGYRADAMPTTHPVAGQAEDTRSALLDFDGISYAKGAATLRQLMAVLGEDAFFAGVRAYFDRHAFGNTTYTDLLAELERASGRDLGDWATAWLRTAGTSTLRPVGGQLVQESPAPGHVMREHRIKVAAFDLEDGTLRRRQTADVHLVGATAPLPDLGPEPDLLLLNDGDLTFAKIRFDPRSLATARSSLAGLADPLARALCWASLWDATRDAELPPGDYVAAVVAAAHVEDDPGVIATLLAQATLAATRYSAPVNQDGRRSQVAAMAWSTAGDADPGSDRQQACVTAAIAAAGSADVPRLHGLLDGSAVPDGLTVDAELRWLVVRRLAVLGAADEALIDAELERDRTAAGERHADYARAARPDAAAKAAAWGALTTEAQLSNYKAEALGLGYWQSGQDALLEGSVESYFTTIEALWAQRSPQVAATLARRLYPSTLVRDDVLARTDHFLAGDLPEGLRRVVLEARDDLRRAVAAQALDGG
ncbi:MAG TPA: aminopeptidase N [Mycobacteriales bacterium]|nr:aminopeptidase N [Mycobacteriales bacterium]